jgi:LacI family transcriptional regulator
MSTIRDVARRAGVAVSTVSRVLNESGYVRVETRERVQQAIAELDFRPNLLARGLISRTSYTIALILPDLTNPFYGPLAKGVEAVARAAGFSVIICNTENQPDALVEWIRQLRNNWIKGLLFAMDPPPEEIWELVNDRIPFVLVDQEVAGFDTDRVVINARDGARQAVRYLAELGHRRIAHIAGPRHAAFERYAGYVEALTAAGLQPSQELVSTPGDFSQEHGYEAMRGFLQIPAERRPTAVFCVNDLAAVGALRAVEEAGLKVPEEISIVGYDDILWARLIKPGLTTVAQPVEELGRLTAELLVKRINQEPIGSPQRICLNTNLVVRASSAAPSLHE